MVSQTHAAMDTYGADCSDLSDLRERIHWCIHNRNHCELIAAAGQQARTDKSLKNSIKILRSHSALRPTLVKRMNWNPHEWMNQGGILLATNPALAQRLIGRGIMLEPEQAIGWFNLGIGLHQQRKISCSHQGLSSIAWLFHTQLIQTLPHATTYRKTYSFNGEWE